MNVKPLLDALGLQEDAARTMADDLRTQIEELHGRLRGAPTEVADER
ncbi:hypothetical protein [Streptomyces roseicoloratus]|nr:hypothetical protein [Streptomyces roseicoloratus]